MTSYPRLFLVLRFSVLSLLFFFFNDTATTEIYTLSLHDALPIYFQPLAHRLRLGCIRFLFQVRLDARRRPRRRRSERSEEHTSELQSRRDLVCRLLLEKKKEKSKVDILSTIAYTITIHYNKHLKS